MTAEYVNDYPRQTAAALMALRGMPPAAVAEATGVHLDTLSLFLKSGESALRDDSFERLFSFLGLKAVGAGVQLVSDRVHFFSIRCGLLSARTRLREGLADVQRILPLTGGVLGLDIGRINGCRTFLLCGDDVRAVVSIRVPLYIKVSLADLGVPPGAFAGFDKVARIPAYYQSLIERQQLSPRYFDVLLSGRFECESTELVRLVALENDIPLHEVITLIEERAARLVAERAPAPVSQAPVASLRHNVLLLTPRHVDQPRRKADSAPVPAPAAAMPAAEASTDMDIDSIMQRASHA